MPLKLVAPRKGKTPYWSVRGTYLRIYLDRSTGLGDRKKAARLKRKWEDEIERGEFAQQGETTFAQAAAAYMRAGGERRFVAKLLNPPFSALPLSKVTQQAIDEIGTKLYPAPATRNRQVHTVVSAILKHAGIDRHIRRPRGYQGARRLVWLTPKQAEALLSASAAYDAEFGIFVLMLLYTGLRLGEGLSLEIAGVHLGESFAYLPHTKNGEPRGVHLPPRLVSAIGQHPRGLERNGRLFRFTKSATLYEALDGASEAAGILLPPRTGFHVLRHTWATWMRQFAGLDVRGLVGTGAWSDQASAARYAHVVATEEAKRADLLPGATIRGKPAELRLVEGTEAA